MTVSSDSYDAWAQSVDALYAVPWGVKPEPCSICGRLTACVYMPGPAQYETMAGPHVDVDLKAAIVENGELKAPEHPAQCYRVFGWSKVKEKALHGFD